MFPLHSLTPVTNTQALSESQLWAEGTETRHCHRLGPGEKGAAASKVHLCPRSAVLLSFFLLPLPCLLSLGQQLFSCLCLLVTVSHPLLYFFSLVKALSPPPLPALWLRPSLGISPRVSRSAHPRAQVEVFSQIEGSRAAKADTDADAAHAGREGGTALGKPLAPGGHAWLREQAAGRAGTLQEWGLGVFLTDFLMCRVVSARTASRSLDV